ncbi:hypothetical protein GRZ55_11195 [Chelativorans sp. ZYF759]|uniref:hypothetical protein n=1 Tax=Chelativorans sp. ZYF759 TaxID=2692213 RepID=UPI00145EF786|nr:hypothetical protein [Chelativorans sp. ZYF759]NMG39809.1 hypothetical protein [Chelativorans sp. ZYF759]
METRQYRVREGVTMVNGAKVPANRIVTLTPTQARYDLDHGRIAPARKARRRRPAKDDHGGR